jgi:GT2 family glycosyltransferase
MFSLGGMTVSPGVLTWNEYLDHPIEGYHQFERDVSRNAAAFRDCYVRFLVARIVAKVQPSLRSQRAIDAPQAFVEFSTRISRALRPSIGRGPAVLQSCRMWTAAIVIYDPRLEALEAALASCERAVDFAQGVVVDNGNSAEAKALVARFPRFRYELNPKGNAGFGQAQNLAFAALPEAEFHAVVNPDVRFESTAIQTLIEALSRNRDAVLAAPALFHANGERQLLCKRYPTIRALIARRFLSRSLADWFNLNIDADYFEMRDCDYAQPMSPEFISGALMFFRRDAFVRLKGFDSRFFLYFEDCDITLRAREIGRAIYVPQAYVTHDWARGSHRSKWLTWVTIVSLVKLFNKHGWRWRDPRIVEKLF